jgi:hypothetical protein
MAVYCGVCAARIDSARENEGSFQTAGDFGGWDVEHGKFRIQDTCESCAPHLRVAVTEAASKIAKKHKSAIEALKAEMTSWADRQKRIKKAKNEFEREWVERQRKLGL